MSKMLISWILWSLAVCTSLVGAGVVTDASKCMEAEFLRSSPSEADRLVVNRGERDFSVRLIKTLFQDFNSTGVDRNIFVGPSSIFQTLLLAYFGSAGTTEAELVQTLGFGGLSRPAVQKSYLFERAFQAVRERNPDLGYKLTHANKLYFDRRVPLDDCVQLLLQEDLGVVDFQESADKARQEINGWVEAQTRNKIKELLPGGSLGPDTKVALVNAAYFKGHWASQFDQAETKRDNFYVDRSTIRSTKFMKQKGKFNYYTSEELRAHVLQMPYVGEDVSMIIILPPFEPDSLSATVSRLTPDNLQGVMAEVKSGFYQVDDLNVQIPRFNIEQSFELAETLGRMGLESLFDPAATNLTNFLSEKHRQDPREQIFINSAKHKSFIEVNEEGSEAAAATALFGFRSARPLFHTHFIANHPFLFFIYDEKTDIILFFGVFQDPKL